MSEHHLDIRNPKLIKAESFPAFDSLAEATKFREQLKAQGHDGVVMDSSHLGGPVHYVAFEPHQAIPKEAAKAAADPVQQALAEHPDMQLLDDRGKPIDAEKLIESTKEEAQRAQKDATAAIKAAVNCFGRRG